MEFADTVTIPKNTLNHKKYCIVNTTLTVLSIVVLSKQLGFVDGQVRPKTANQHTGILFPGQKVNW